MNITKAKREKIQKLGRKGFSEKKIAKLLFPRAYDSGHSLKPISKILKGITFHKTPGWLQIFR